MPPKASTPFWKSASLSGRISSSENEKLVAAGPVSRILRGHVAATEVIEAKSWQSVKNVKIVSVGRFCVTPASQSASAYRDLRNTIAMKTPRREKPANQKKLGKQELGQGHLPRNPPERTLNDADGFSRDGVPNP